jgi:hypothetical protein
VGDDYSLLSGDVMLEVDDIAKHDNIYIGGYRWFVVERAESHFGM